jgi:hypothetical protein
MTVSVELLPLLRFFTGWVCRLLSFYRFNFKDFAVNIFLLLFSVLSPRLIFFFLSDLKHFICAGL